MRTLLFRLQAPMAAWGEIAVGERRGSWTRPGKSAVLGLVAAALGHRRTEGEAHAALHAGLGYAVRVDDPGRPLRDYHTAQAPSARKNARFETRRDELAVPKHALNTILSERLYYGEPKVTVALWCRDDAAPGPAWCPSLDTIEQALRRPVFTLHLGRKSCPPGRPLSPSVLEADDLPAAFAAYDAAEAEAEVRAETELKAVAPHYAPRPLEGSPEIWADLEAGFDFRPAEVARRRDALRDRPRWLFADRREGRLPNAELPAEPQP